jgi:hypothetical protein
VKDFLNRSKTKIQNLQPSKFHVNSWQKSTNCDSGDSRWEWSVRQIYPDHLRKELWADKSQLQQDGEEQSHGVAGGVV